MRDLTSLEEQVAQDRVQLTQSLSALSDTLSPGRVSDEVSALSKSLGGDVAAQAMTAIRNNPAAAALIGAGVGLFLTGAGTRPVQNQARKSSQPSTSFDARVAAADAKIKQEMTGMMPDAHQASRMRVALDRGLEALPSSARARVRNARKAALDAQEQLEKRATRAAARSRTFHQQQPLAVGAVALGLGALIGALLPTTRREDALLGERRDALLAKAQETLDDEVAKLSATAQSKIVDAARAANPNA